jgi:ATP-dependent DNA helicase RecG
MDGMSEDPLLSSVQFVRGVGPQRAALLARLGLQTVEQLLYCLPRDLLDLSHVVSVGDLVEETRATVRGTVVDVDAKELSGGRTLYAILVQCDGAFVRAVWFNQAWVLQKFQIGQVVLLSGRPKRRAGRWEFAHPQIQWLEAEDDAAAGMVLPRYGLTEGLKMHQMRRIARNAVEDHADRVPELLPATLRESQRLQGISQALRAVHMPASIAAFEEGRRRLVFQDLLELQLGLALKRRAQRRRGSAPSLVCTAKIDARIRGLLPFKLTSAQEQAIRAIRRDLESTTPMHRLLQGEVGSGKTVVAVYGMLLAVALGYQCALMAPTEVLANQHWHTLEELLGHSRVARLLLTGALPQAARRQALERLASGEVQLVVGTQALIQEGVRFARLAFVVIDEQHKFGVMQRARVGGGQHSPHVLVMTATPIPRSLCLTQFGELDLTVMKELPPGRQPVLTAQVPPGENRLKAWSFIRQKLLEGRQAYVVCPRITDDGSATAGEETSALAAWKGLSSQELKGFRCGLLHGRLDADARQASMEAFRSGDVQVLVATTVVEVGIDVPNATIMVVLHAESFGLSGLHQLRGRVARGSFKGYCFLFSDDPATEAAARLQTLERCSDGFEVAEADFRLRGGGDLLGTKQHGELPLRIAELPRDEADLLLARDAAQELVRTGAFDLPEYAPLKIRVLERFERLFDISGGG